MGEETCDGFFQHITEPICANFGMDAQQGQRCPVSTECAEHNAFMKEGKLNFKYCTESDPSLKALSPTELRNFSDKYELDIGLLCKLAYPVVKGPTWDAAKMLWTKPDQLSLSREKMSDLLKIKDSGVPHVIDSNSGHPPFAIVQGDSAWEITLDMAYIGKTMMSGKSVFAHPHELTTFKKIS